MPDMKLKQQIKKNIIRRNYNNHNTNNNNNNNNNHGDEPGSSSMCSDCSGIIINENLITQ